ncbi:MAG: shikimate dehydrogenase [Promethearchaeota archaeon]
MTFEIPRITAKTKILAVIGDPIEHSMSPTMHNAAIEELNLDYVYIAFNVKKENLKQACDGFRALNIKGINVTIPHKVEIMKYLDEIDPIAKGIGAINTIKNDNGKLIAKNTDGEGFIKSLEDVGFNVENKKCLILGCGGAARAIAFMLGTKAKEIILTDIIPDAAEKLYNNLTEFYSKNNTSNLIGNKQPLFRKIALNSETMKNELENIDLLVNATPVGMHPKTDKSPLDDLNVQLNKNIFVFDVVYNPLKTKLLKDAESAGCQYLGGINMLVNQGAIAFEWWTGYKPNTELMRKAAIKKLNIK